MREGSSEDDGSLIAWDESNTLQHFRHYMEGVVRGGSGEGRCGEGGCGVGGVVREVW